MGGANIDARRIVVSGQVQGVGFRPYVFRHALAHKLCGWVMNTGGWVELHVQGKADDLERFTATLIERAPPLACPKIVSLETRPTIDTDEFIIRESQATLKAENHLPPDLFLCEHCLRELSDPDNRRYRYPFINCTQCGPRYTIITSLPYDRPNTSMHSFPLCANCTAEYTAPSDRRYHAEPIACETCGPTLKFTQSGEIIRSGEDAIRATVEALTAGHIMAIKGIGGYHLICDARNDEAVRLLRARKSRPNKPFAVIFPAPVNRPLQFVNADLEPTDLETHALLSAARPIVLIKYHEKSQLSSFIAPGLNEIGAMLPYSPLHHLLLNDFGGPIVATSANITGEPVLTDNTEVGNRLSHIADAYLHHDRPIIRPADDSVVRLSSGVVRPLRIGRGIAPLEIDLPFELPHPLLALGAQMKNTIALAWEGRAIISPHIGEMGSPRSLKIFQTLIADLQALYQVKAEHIICDAHPSYTTSRWAQQQGLPTHKIYHHHAHASAAYFESSLTHDDTDPQLIFTWDGVGYGEDGNFWGGDALLGTPGNWQRVAHLRPFHLPGADKASREPWRSAAALCWELGLPYGSDLADPLLHHFWKKRQNTYQTTAVGRLFDGAAALCGIAIRASYEGQAAMQIEAKASKWRKSKNLEITPLSLEKNRNSYIVDWAPLIPLMQSEEKTIEERAIYFHATLAQSIVDQATTLRDQHGDFIVSFSGGVFQNRVLLEMSEQRLIDAGFTVHIPERLPMNDAAISFGQIIEFAHSQKHGSSPQ